MTNTHPTIKWSQKKDHILLTIAVQDIEKPDISIESTKLHFKGQQTKGLNYDTLLEFFDEIDPKTSKYRKISQNHWEFMLKKKNANKQFWKRLIKSTDKCPWITVDWNHYADDGDEDEEPTTNNTDGKDWGNIDAMLKQMGGDAAAASRTDLNNVQEKEVDSDDEVMPDLEEVQKTNDQKS